MSAAQDTAPERRRLATSQRPCLTGSKPNLFRRAACRERSRPRVVLLLCPVVPLLFGDGSHLGVESLVQTEQAHGKLVPLISLFLLWHIDRKLLLAAPKKGSNAGLLFILTG